MNWDSQQSYKSVIKSRIKELREKKSDLTLKKLAGKIPIQYTYLSRVLNDESVHLNEDDLFRLGELLDFLPNELEFLLLLRGHQTATKPGRKRFIFDRLETMRKKLSLRAEDHEPDEAKLRHEMAYLFDPNCVVLWVALSIRRYRENPRLLCPLIGVDPDRLREMLKKLETVDLIELEPGTTKILKVNKSMVHFQKTNPLMRVHQYLMKILLQDRVLNAAEEDKESFQATFTADTEVLGEIREEFQKFVARVQEKSILRKPDRVYQLSFDLCRWF